MDLAHEPCGLGGSRTLCRKVINLEEKLMSSGSSKKKKAFRKTYVLWGWYEGVDFVNSCKHL